jgi:hypothetical protein
LEKVYRNGKLQIVNTRGSRLLEVNLGRLQHWLRDWRITINDSKNTAVLFVKTARCIKKPRAAQFLGEPIQWVETAIPWGYP